MRLALLSPSALALLLALPGCDKERAESIKLTNEAIQKENLGDAELAYALYARAAAIDPTNHRALYQMALIEMFDKKQTDKALKHLEEAERLVADDRDVLFQLGRYHATLEKPDADKAIGYLDRALAADPNYAPAMYFKGAMLAAKDDAKGADKALREAIAMDPKYAPAWRDLGELYERFDQQAAATEIYLKGAEYADQKQEIYNNLGLLKMEENLPKEAILFFNKALEESGERDDVVFNLAFAFVAADDTRSAFRYLGEFINRSDGSSPENIKVAHLLRAAMLEKLEKERAEKPDQPAPSTP